MLSNSRCLPGNTAGLCNSEVIETWKLPPLECPFCSSIAVRLIECDANQFAVCCDGCLAIGPSAATDELATNTWNTARRTAPLGQSRQRMPK